MRVKIEIKCKHTDFLARCKFHYISVYTKNFLTFKRFRTRMTSFLKKYIKLMAYFQLVGKQTKTFPEYVRSEKLVLQPTREQQKRVMMNSVDEKFIYILPDG